ncbi:MAG: hypothetical protein WD052_08780 [Bacteroidales bacterium]
MMKKTKVLVIIVLVILLIPLTGYAAWMIKKGKSLEIFVVNKSMTDFRGSENKAMNYILHSEKVFTAGNRLYDLTIDHYGLLWNNGDYSVKFPRLKELERTVEKSDLVYYADVSGIRSADIKQGTLAGSSKVEYGGLNNSDYTFIREYMRENKPLILEFSFLEPPTDPLIRYNLEKITDIYFLGWVGKYVSDLAGELGNYQDIDCKELFREYTGSEWSASGPGIFMVHQELGRIFVLEEGKHIQTTDGLVVSTAEAAERFNVSRAVNFNGWFTLLHAGENEVLSQFDLNATAQGTQLLNEFGIPERFPALIMVDKNVHVMTGDFGKCKPNMLLPKMMGLGSVVEGMKRKSKRSSNFFYAYFQPFMTAVLEDASRIRESEEGGGI